MYKRKPNKTRMWSMSESYYRIRVSEPVNGEWIAHMQCTVPGCNKYYVGDFRHEPVKCPDCRDPYNPEYFGNAVFSRKIDHRWKPWTAK